MNEKIKTTALRQALAALELAEDVLSRSPHSTRLWHNGMHPNDGINRIRDAISALKEIPRAGHECPDWDFLMIYPGDPEMECCTCKLGTDQQPEK